MAAVLLAPASIVSLVNCAILVFGAAATRAVLGARYSRAQWAGIAVAGGGVLVVGVASFFGDGGGAIAATPDGVIHLVLPPTKFFFPVHEVLCESGNQLGVGEKLDVLLMGAAMAAINATEKQAPAGGL